MKLELNKKINIAICLSTEPRFWQTAADSISNFRNLNENEQCQVDVFYHFWDDVTCQWPDKPREVKLTDDPIIKNIDPATLQHHFKPTVGVCESKDTLDPSINEAWEYVQSLKQKYNISDSTIARVCLKWTLEELKAINMSIKEAFYATIKRTNRIKFSQIMSMCKSLILMSDYAEKNNIYYDVVIRSRSDVYIKPTKFKSIQTTVQKDQLSRCILFPDLSVKSPWDKSHGLHTPYAIFDFFVSSSNIIKKDIFKDYTKKIIELMFLAKSKNKLLKRSVQNIVPLFLKQRREVVLRGRLKPFGWSYYQKKVIHKSRNHD